MNAMQKRGAAYGAAAVVCGGLVYAGCVYESDPDVLTMLGSVDVQLRMASVMPERDKAGGLVAERAVLLASARDYLDRIERLESRSVPTLEYRAFLAYLERDYARAAALYREMRTAADCTDDLRDQAVLNEARVLRMAGRDGEAATLLEWYREKFLPENADAARRELAQAVGAAGRSTPAARPAAGER